MKWGGDRGLGWGWGLWWGWGVWGGDGGFGVGWDLEGIRNDTSKIMSVGLKRTMGH